MAAVLGLAAGQARAATDVYPAGGSTFSGSAEGWQVTAASCDVALLCSASGGYDGSSGNPAGSLAANTSVALNLLTLFKSTVTLQSPDFKVAEAGTTTLHLDRQFAPGGLLDLSPQVDYSVRLIDRTAGTESQPFGETVSEASGFSGKDAAASVKAGHTYALAITAETSSTVVSLSAAGTSSARFDNVSLSVQTSGGGGGGGSSGAGDLSDQRLRGLIQSSLAGPATLKGKRIFVKAGCPDQIGQACRITLQGLLRKGRAATAKRTTTIAKGKARRLALKIKPKARGKLAKRNRLLFKQTVRVGGARATVYKRLKLIRR